MQFLSYKTIRIILLNYNSGRKFNVLDGIGKANDNERKRQMMMKEYISSPMLCQCSDFQTIH